MKERTRKFLEQFKELNNDDFRVSFADIFTEFIDILNSLDLSDKTLLYITELFNKDMQLFFIDMEIKKKKFISKEKDILNNENAFNKMFEDSKKSYNKLFNENLF